MGTAVYFFFNSARALFFFLAAGILIDIDHVLDYYLQEGVTLKLGDMYAWFTNGKFRFLFLFFHSLELLFLLWFVISFYKLGEGWVFFSLGLTQHIILDLVSNQGFKPYAYFLTYRVIKRFRIEDILV